MAMPQNHSSARDAKRLALRNVDDYLYAAAVGIGSPPQTFSVLLDTGSADAWVPAQRCSTCGAHRRFDRRASATFRDLHTPFAGAYGSGASAGDVVGDVLTIGASAVPGVALALIASETGDIPRFPTDGVLGLAFAGVSTIDGQPTLLDALARALPPPLRPVFALRLTRESDADGAEFHLGGVDAALAGGPGEPRVAYFPVVALPGDGATLSYWTLALTDVHGIESASASASSSSSSPSSSSTAWCSAASPCFAIVDSGSSLIYVPPHIFDAVVAFVVRGKRCDVALLQCTGARLAEFPSLSFSFGGGGGGDGPAANRFVLPPASYVACDASGACTINLQNHGDVGDGLFWWVLGDTFLQAFYTVFDFGQRRVGFACGDRGNCAVGQ